MRHETYIDVLKSVFLTVVCLVFFPLLLPAISPSQDPNGVPENLLIFGEEEEEQSASIHHVDSLSDASSDDPDWYVEPIIPDSLKAPFGAPRSSVRGFGEEEAERSASISRADSRSGVSADDRAPMRASAAGCLTDSILTFNQDSVLTEATTYDYDAAGRTIRTTVWQYNSDGTRTGKSKQEYAYDTNGTQIYTGTFAWDAVTNDWKGTDKSEFVYNEAHQMESNITYTWVNNTWLPQTAYTYAYDAAGHETEYTTYARDAAVNHLVHFKQRLRTYENNAITVEINYTAYADGAWSAGNRKDYQYDAKGNRIDYIYYSSYSNGTWVGSTHERWLYNASNKKLLYEKTTWKSGAWTNTSKEVWEYEGANNTLYEKYSGSGTNWKGSKKETYTYNAANKKTGTISYKWTNSTWVNNQWTVSDYDAAGNAIESCKYTWKDGKWEGNGTRVVCAYDNAKRMTDQVLQSWSATDSTWVNSTRYTAVYSGSRLTQEAYFAWMNEAWIGTSRSDYHYNTLGQNDTTKTYTNNGTDWIYSARTVNTYDSRGNTILTHNASWNGTAWIMTSMNRQDLIYDNANHLLLNATWSCSSDSVWVGLQKDTNAYTAAGQTLFIARYTSWSNNTWVPSYKVEYAYDDANRKTEEKRSNWTNNDWVGSFWNQWGYDANGRQVMSASYIWSGGSWFGTNRSTSVWGNDGRKISSISYSYSGGIWTPTFQHYYTYDAQGRVIDEVVARYRNDSWEDDTRYIHEFDARGTTVKNNQYGWTGTYWRPISIVESEYDAVDNKIRREINGSWNSGVVISYADNHYFYSCDAPTVNNGSQPRTPTELEEIDENNGNYENYDTNVQPFDPMLPTYNLQGQSVDPVTYHGIVIQNGKKYVL